MLGSTIEYRELTLSGFLAYPNGSRPFAASFVPVMPGGVGRLYTVMGITTGDGQISIPETRVLDGEFERDLQSLPDPVVDLFGYALYLAQTGKKHDEAKPLKGFGSAGVLEVVEDWDRSTYRDVYTVQFKGFVFVLHIFQKKSTCGSATPKGDIDIIRERLKVAEQIAKELSR